MRIVFSMWKDLERSHIFLKLVGLAQALLWWNEEGSEQIKFSFYFLPFTFYLLTFLLFAFHFKPLLFTLYFLLFAFYFFLLTSYFLLFLALFLWSDEGVLSRSNLLFTLYFLFFTFYFFWLQSCGGMRGSLADQMESLRRRRQLCQFTTTCLKLGLNLFSQINHSDSLQQELCAFTFFTFSQLVWKLQPLFFRFSQVNYFAFLLIENSLQHLPNFYFCSLKILGSICFHKLITPTLRCSSPLLLWHQMNATNCTNCLNHQFYKAEFKLTFGNSEDFHFHDLLQDSM